MEPYLVGGLEHFLFFLLGIIIPTDYFSEGLKPPVTNVEAIDTLCFKVGNVSEKS